MSSFIAKNGEMVKSQLFVLLQLVGPAPEYLNYCTTQLGIEGSMDVLQGCMVYTVQV